MSDKVGAKLHKKDAFQEVKNLSSFWYCGESDCKFYGRTTSRIDPTLKIFQGCPVMFTDNMDVEVLMDTSNDEILAVELPASLVMEVTYTEPGVKGDTATNTLKPATLETGAEIRVPLFINIGDKVKVNTETGDYMERMKG